MKPTLFLLAAGMGSRYGDASEPILKRKSQSKGWDFCCFDRLAA